MTLIGIGKRLLLIVGFFPVIIVSGLWWMLTGRSVVGVVDAFIDWCVRD